ncbi:MAG: hypothetical protein JXR52_02610 [Bacteroidales bacterium]|nr:hypothetical protein [Bacteroidales bacterium]
MKIANNYIRPLGAFLLAMLLFVSCAEFEEYTSNTYGSGPDVTLSAVSVLDSTITVAVTSSADGFATVALFPGTGNPVPDSASLIEGNVSALAIQTKKVISGQATNFVFGGLVQDMNFEFMAAANNADGKVGDVATLTVKTDDNYPPVFVDSDPTSSYSAVLEADAPIVLYFDEPVLYDDTKDFVFTTLYTAMNEVAVDVVVDGNAVAVYPPAIPESEYVMLSWPEGTVTDPSGNQAAEMVSEFIAEEGYIVGVYTRRVMPARAPVSVEPAVDSIASGGDIVITFNEAVRADRAITKDMIILEYYEWDSEAESYYFDHSTAVDPATLVFDGASVAIPQSFAAPYGWWVDVTVAEAAFDIGLFVPNAEVTGGWWTY